MIEQPITFSPPDLVGSMYPAQALPRWDSPSISRIPYWAYTDDAVYQRELERLFYQGHWCYVGLEAEIPNSGDFKRTKVGERSVILIRDKDGGINVVENRCAHRGDRKSVV